MDTAMTDIAYVVLPVFIFLFLRHTFNIIIIFIYKALFNIGRTVLLISYIFHWAPKKPASSTCIQPKVNNNLR